MKLRDAIRRRAGVGCCSRAAARRAPRCAAGSEGSTTTVEDAEKNGAMNVRAARARGRQVAARVRDDRSRPGPALERRGAPREGGAQRAGRVQHEPRRPLHARASSSRSRPRSRAATPTATAFPDSVDQCILEPEDKDGYLDDDGCPDIDNDGDGIPDSKDKCPNEPEDFDGFQDDDGCPDPDNDGDGVADVDDYCPNTPGIPGGDKPGCPRKSTLIVVTEKEIRITQQIQFEFNKAVIKPGISYKILDEVVGVLTDNPKIASRFRGTPTTSAPTRTTCICRRRALTQCVLIS